MENETFEPQKTTAPSGRRPKPVQVAPPPAGNDAPIPTGGPQFGEPKPSPDPTKFTVQHGSDDDAYKIIDATPQFPRPFPTVQGKDEPILQFADALGPSGATIVGQIQKAGQLVFHSVGDTGNTKGPRDQNLVADKMLSDYHESDPRNVPSFFFHLGDVVYSFGESQYYYDQFYDPYRDYPAPIFALAGNHDGMVAPKSSATTLESFLENFCQAGQPPHRTPEAGGLVRTAQVQPGIYYTLEAPFVRILALYSNTLEDPGVISTENGNYPYLTDVQLTFLKTALARVVSEKFAGAVIIAVHHPPYVAITNGGIEVGKHGSSPEVLSDIDQACQQAGCYPHAVLCAHAHNYQRFTRRQGNRETLFVVAGGGGHGIAHLTRKGEPALRAPAPQAGLSNGSDSVTLESYDDQHYGYLRIVVDPKQLRIEYHPADDGAGSKTPDDFVTVDIAQRKLIHYQVQGALSL